MRSKLNEWCESVSDINGPSEDWFVDLTATDYKEYENEQSYIQDYIDEKWKELKSHQHLLEITDEEVYRGVQSLACKYQRKSSENSCYDPKDVIMTDMKYETCDTRGIIDKDLISLDIMLEFDGVKQNECLKKRRKEIYPIAEYLDDSMKLKLCNGAYDYLCPDWSHPRLDNELLSDKGEIKLLFNNNNNNGYTLYIAFGSLIVFLIVSICFAFVNKHNPKKKKNKSQEQNAPYGTF